MFSKVSYLPTITEVKNMQYFNDLMDWVGALGIIAILIFVGLLILAIILQVVFLRIGIKAAKGGNREFGKVFGTVILNFLVIGYPICTGT